MSPQPDGSALPPRATNVARWVGWHSVELGALGATASAAVALSPWWLIATGAFGVAWRANERRIARRRRAVGELTISAAPELETADEPRREVDDADRHSARC